MKSAERVRDLGEVFTPASTVASMLDLLPADTWRAHPAATFLEPSAGDGNFLVAILARKLAAIREAQTRGGLPAGNDDAALEFHALEALASVYAVDISIDNIAGGPGHGPGARNRLFDVFASWYAATIGKALTTRSVITACALWVLERNVMVANMLPLNPDGSPSGRDDLPLIEYRWDPEQQTVELLTTTLGQVEAAARAESEKALTLFDAHEPPTLRWAGRARDLRDAPIPAPSAFNGPVHNGKKVR